MNIGENDDPKFQDLRSKRKSGLIALSTCNWFSDIKPRGCSAHWTGAHLPESGAFSTRFASFADLKVCASRILPSFRGTMARVPQLCFGADAIPCRPMRKWRFGCALSDSRSFCSIKSSSPPLSRPPGAGECAQPTRPTWVRSWDGRCGFQGYAFGEETKENKWSPNGIKTSSAG